MGSCVTHLLLLLYPPLRPDAPLFTLYTPPPQNPQTDPHTQAPISSSLSVLLLFIYPLFSTSSCCLLDMTEIVRSMTHCTQVFSDTRCCQQASVPMEEKKTQKQKKSTMNSYHLEHPVENVYLFRHQLLSKMFRSTIPFDVTAVVQRHRQAAHHFLMYRKQTVHTE